MVATAPVMDTPVPSELASMVARVVLSEAFLTRIIGPAERGLCTFSLKVTDRDVGGATFTAAFAGVTDTMVGGVMSDEAVLKFQRVALEKPANGLGEGEARSTTALREMIT